MLLNDIGKSPDTTFRKINNHLELNYGFKITEDVSDKDLVSIMEQIEGEITELKIKGNDAKASPEISKRMLVLEGIKTLREFAMVQLQSPDLDKVVNGLSDYVVKLFKLSGTAPHHFDECVNDAMNHYRSSQYRFPDEMIRDKIHRRAMSNLGVPDEGEISVIGEGPMLDTEIETIDEDDPWGHVNKRDHPGQSGTPDELTRDQHSVADRILGKSKEPGLAPTTVRGDGRTQAEIPASWLKPIPKRNRFKEGQIMNEQANLVKNLRRLLETEVSQAEVMMAAKGFASELQEMIEKIGRLQNEDLPPVTDQMRETYGMESASAFQTQIYGALQSVMDSLYTAKGQVDDAVSNMAETGQFSAQTDMDKDMGMDGAVDAAAMDADADMGAAELDLDNIASDLDTEKNDEFGGADEEEPLGRAMKSESVKLKRKVLEMKRLLAKAKKLKEARK